ncbi:Methyl-accepting chemotaxis protein I (serine chemoreceptor protein) [Pseudonocardia sp. Ae717_Ps2]|nr:Methyl-accepting chemotaxis protein I (serine chemoreceptor protein) [Pseudonocardia sp. Ae717_Ps2]OLM28091.1 Methyl-accepting chemotaxis protein I (serine chemoreceptor protein) [Pseudonocardia sp. Ae717_Ps2]
MSVTPSSSKPGSELVRRSVGTVARRGDAALREHLVREARIEQGVRARRAPFLAVGGVAVLGWVGWGLHELLRLGAGDAAAILAAPVAVGVTGAAGAAVAIGWRRQLGGHHRRFAIVTTAAAAWVGVVSLFSPASWTAMAVLVLGAIGLCSRWQAAHAVPQPGPDAAAQAARWSRGTAASAAGTSRVEIAEMVQRWEERIAAERGPIPDSQLVEPQVLPAAVRFTVATVPGSTSFDTAHALRGRIASGLQRPSSRIVLEPSDVDESMFDLTVITRDVLADGVPYTGPVYHDGRVEIGAFADGDDTATYTAADRAGARNGLATGEPGSGKSAFLESVGMGLLSSGSWHLMFGDGDPEGGSSPLLMKVAHWSAAGPEGVLAQLTALEVLLEVRSMVKATLTIGTDGRPVAKTDPRQPSAREIHPCPAFPGVQWILDELQRLVSDPLLVSVKFAERLERLVRIGRKYGIGLLVGTQSLLLADYGNRSPLRGYLANRNLFAFRNSNKSERAVVAGLEISPSVLPTGGGYAFSAGAGRLAMLRVAWAPDMARHAEGLDSATLDSDSELAMAPHRPVPVDEDDALTEQLARLAAWRQAAGHPAPGGTPATPSTPGSPVSSVFADPAQITVPAALTGDNIIPMPVRGSLPVLGAVPADLDALSGTQRAVLDAVRGGQRATGAIAGAAEVTTSAASKALSALADLGLVTKAGHGQWDAALAGAGQQR